MRTYGALSLTASSPAQSFDEPLELAEVIKFLELPEREDEAEESMLEGFISAAREQAEILQGRDLVVKSYDLALDCFPCGEIELREPLVGVDLVKYRDSDGDYATLVEDTGYIVDLARALILPPYGESWPSFTPWPSSAVLVRFRSGLATTDAFWSDAGARLKVGMKQLVSEYYGNRLPVSYDLSAGGGGSPAVDRITWLLSMGGKRRCR